MSLFRRREEPLHERLLREGGLDVVAAEPSRWEAEPPLPRAPQLDVLHGQQRPREWDAVVTASAPGLRGNALDFVVLEDGSVLMEHALPAGSLEPLCDAVEATLRPPYRAHAVRKGEALWAVSARRLRLVELALDGNELTLTVTASTRELVVDGRERREPLPELELRNDLPPEFHARGTRVDGDRWELDVSAL